MINGLRSSKSLTLEIQLKINSSKLVVYSSELGGGRFTVQKVPKTHLLFLISGCLPKPRLPQILDEVLAGKVDLLHNACLLLDYYLVDSYTYNKPADWMAEVKSLYTNSPIKVKYSIVQGQDRSAWTDHSIPSAEFTGNIKYKDGSTATTNVTVEFSFSEGRWKINLTNWLVYSAQPAPTNLDRLTPIKLILESCESWFRQCFTPHYFQRGLPTFFELSE